MEEVDQVGAGGFDCEIKKCGSQVTDEEIAQELEVLKHKYFALVKKTYNFDYSVGCDNL